MQNKKIVSTSVLLACSAVSTYAQATLPDNAILKFEPGIVTCVADAGTPPNCTYATLVDTGSYFGMDTDGDGVILSIERIALVVNVGIALGTIQIATGTHSGAPDGTESPGIDQAWAFFGNTGLHLTTIAPTTLTDGGAGGVTLDFSGWTVAWNGIAVIPMGSGAWDGNADGVAIMTCAVDCAENDTYVLDYSATVPLGDPSGFGGVKYAVHFEGTVIGPPVPPATVAVNLAGGSIQECNTANGANIYATPNVTIDSSDAVSGISWFLDGENAGNESYLMQFVGLGMHQIEVNVTTVNGYVATDSMSFTVEDTQPPVITAQFINRFTGEPVNTLELYNNFIGIKAETTDTCDPSAAVTNAMYGTPTIDGGIFAPYGFEGGFVIPQSQLLLRVEAKDASGNIAVESTALSAP